jgi:glucose uptake protein GlcU
MPITTLLGKIADLILNPLIILGFVIATIFLFYGIAEMIWKADDSGGLEKNRDNVKYGIIGLFVMFSVYGILNLIVHTFGITCTSAIFFCK